MSAPVAAEGEWEPDAFDWSSRRHDQHNTGSLVPAAGWGAWARDEWVEKDRIELVYPPSYPLVGDLTGDGIPVIALATTDATLNCDAVGGDLTEILAFRSAIYLLDGRTLEELEGWSHEDGNVSFDDESVARTPAFSNLVDDDDEVHRGLVFLHNKPLSAEASKVRGVNANAEILREWTNDASAGGLAGAIVAANTDDDNGASGELNYVMQHLEVDPAQTGVGVSPITVTLTVKDPWIKIYAADRDADTFAWTHSYGDENGPFYATAGETVLAPFAANPGVQLGFGTGLPLVTGKAKPMPCPVIGDVVVAGRNTADFDDDHAYRTLNSTVETDGESWTHELDGNIGGTAALADLWLSATEPVVASLILIEQVGTNARANVTVLDARAGSAHDVLWRVEDLPAIPNVPAVADVNGDDASDLLLVGAASRLDPLTGDRNVWLIDGKSHDIAASFQFDAEGPEITGAPVLVDAAGDGWPLALLTLNQTATMPSQLVALNASNLEELWRLDLVQDMAPTVSCVDVDADDDGRCEILVTTGTPELAWGNYENNLIVYEPKAPDLEIEDLQVDGVPVLNEPVTVRATVRNAGTRAALDVAIRLYDGDAEVETVDVDVAANATQEVSFTWTPSTAGSRTLKAVADPAKTIPELQENDNDLAKSVSVKQRPVCDFTYPADPKEEPAVQFSDASTDPDSEGTIVEWSWDFGLDGTSTERNPSVNFADGGDKTVSLNVKDNDDLWCAARKVQTVPVADIPPDVNFLIGSGDESVALSFTDKTTHKNPADNLPATWNYTWDFNREGQSYDQNPQFRFHEGGPKSITLTVIDDDGQRASATQNFTLAHAKPSPDFEASSGTELETISFTDRSTHPNTPYDDPPTNWTYAWNFNDEGASAEQNPSFDFADGGDKKITLTVTDDDNQTASHSETIHVGHVAPVAAIRVVSGNLETDTYELQDESSHPNAPTDGIASRSWTCSDGYTATDPVIHHRFPDGPSASCTLTVQDNDNQSASFTKSFSVDHVAPRANFSIGDGDEGSPIDFRDQSTHDNSPTDDPPGGWNYTWDFNGEGTSYEQSPSFDFEEAGPKSVTLTVRDNDGQSDSVTKTFTLGESSPVADFDVEGTYETDLYQFTDTSYHPNAPGNTIVARAWSCSDGFSSNETNPDHRFAEGDTYSCTLTVTDDEGFEGSINQSIRVRHVLPKPDFSASSGSELETIQFTDKSTHDHTPADDPPTGWTYHWDFNNGEGTSSERNPRFDFADGGDQPVTLTVTDNDNASASITLTVPVAQVTPVAAIRVVSGSLETDTYELRDESSHPNAPTDYIKSRLWTCSDGYTATDPVIHHRFPDGPRAWCRLTVTDDDNQQDTNETTFDVAHVDPVADFTFSGTDEASPYQFTDASYHRNSPRDDPAEGGWRYAWDFNKGEGTSNESNPRFDFAEGGDKTVTLTVTDNDGRSHTASQTIPVVHAKPKAAFTFDPKKPNVGQSVRFTDQSTHPNTPDDDPPTGWNYTWDFGDGATNTERSPSHEYASSGVYTVKLTVKDDDGEEATASDSVTVNTPPTADFSWSPTTPTDLQQVQFTDASSDSDGSVASWAWEFGDGATSSEKNPRHQYVDDGLYTVTLTVTDNLGAFSIKSQPIEVLNVAPTADYSYDMDGLLVATPLTPITVTFTDHSTDPDGHVVAWLWDFDDGATSTVQSPAHAYSYGGAYNVKLTVKDDDGAPHSVTQTICVPGARVDDLQVGFNHIHAEPSACTRVLL